MELEQRAQSAETLHPQTWNHTEEQLGGDQRVAERGAAPVQIDVVELASVSRSKRPSVGFSSEASRNVSMNTRPSTAAVALALGAQDGQIERDVAADDDAVVRQALEVDHSSGNVRVSLTMSSVTPWTTVDAAGWACRGPPSRPSGGS